MRRSNMQIYSINTGIRNQLWGERGLYARIPLLKTLPGFLSLLGSCQATCGSDREFLISWRPKNMLKISFVNHLSHLHSLSVVFMVGAWAQFRPAFIFSSLLFALCCVAMVCSRAGEKNERHTAFLVFIHFVIKWRNEWHGTQVADKPLIFWLSALFPSSRAVFSFFLRSVISLTGRETTATLLSHLGDKKVKQ